MLDTASPSTSMPALLLVLSCFPVALPVAFASRSNLQPLGLSLRCLRQCLGAVNGGYAVKLFGGGGGRTEKRV